MDWGEFAPSAKKKISSCNKTLTKPALCHIQYTIYISSILTNKIHQWLFYDIIAVIISELVYILSYDRIIRTPTNRKQFLSMFCFSASLTILSPAKRLVPRMLTYCSERLSWMRGP